MLLKGPSTAVCFSQKQKENFLCVFCTAQIFQGVWLCFSRYWRGQYSAHLPIILVFFHKRSHPWNFSPLILRQGDISVAAPDYTYFFFFSPLSIFFREVWVWEVVVWLCDLDVEPWTALFHPYGPTWESLPPPWTNPPISAHPIFRRILFDVQQSKIDELSYKILSN